MRKLNDSSVQKEITVKDIDKGPDKLADTYSTSGKGGDEAEIKKGGKSDFFK